MTPLTAASVAIAALATLVALIFWRPIRQARLHSDVREWRAAVDYALGCETRDALTFLRAFKAGDRYLLSTHYTDWPAFRTEWLAKEAEET